MAFMMAGWGGWPDKGRGALSGRPTRQCPGARGWHAQMEQTSSVRYLVPQYALPPSHDSAGELHSPFLVCGRPKHQAGLPPPWWESQVRKLHQEYQSCFQRRRQRSSTTLFADGLAARRWPFEGRAVLHKFWADQGARPGAPASTDGAHRSNHPHCLAH